MHRGQRSASATTREIRGIQSSSMKCIKNLIANRGEIACRVIRACREMKIACWSHSSLPRNADRGRWRFIRMRTRRSSRPNGGRGVPHRPAAVERELSAAGQIIDAREDAACRGNTSGIRISFGERRICASSERSGITSSGRRPKRWNRWAARSRHGGSPSPPAFRSFRARPSRLPRLKKRETVAAEIGLSGDAQGFGGRRRKGNAARCR